MLGKNFVSNHTLVRGGGTVASGTDAALTGVSAPADGVDLTDLSAQRVIGVLEFSAAGGTSRVDVAMQTRNAAGDAWTTLGTLSDLTPVANRYLVAEVDTNSARVQRYVRLAYRRKTANSTIARSFYVVGEYRRPGVNLVRADVSAGGVIKEKTALPNA